jgi:hypothetical protein
LNGLVSQQFYRNPRRTLISTGVYLQLSRKGIAPMLGTHGVYFVRKKKIGGILYFKWFLCELGENCDENPIPGKKTPLNSQRWSKKKPSKPC